MTPHVQAALRGAKNAVRMYSVDERIKHAPACDVLALSDAEKSVYNGAGRKLALFTQGILAAFHDPMSVESSPDTDAMINRGLEAAAAWIAVAMPQIEVWLVMRSGYELCQPRRISNQTLRVWRHRRFLQHHGDALITQLAVAARVSTRV